MKTKYIQLSEKGNSLPILETKAFKTQCCDCGLTHIWEVKNKENPVYKISIDKKTTERVRRKRFYKVKEIRNVKSLQDKWVIILEKEK